MNRRMIVNTLGRMCQLSAALMVLPLIVALLYREYKQALCFLIAISVAFVFGTLLSLICHTKNKVIYAKEGFVTVVGVWITVSVFGALPFVISGEIPSFVDAFFETVSGFTTTGASILTNVESLSKSMLFWRSFTHWIGGMGILVFVMAIIPKVSDRSIHLMRAEVPGPVVGKIVPRIKDTAKILYLIYIFLTLLETALLYFGGMSLFDSIVHSLGTAGTGGFGIRSDSIASYSVYSQWVIAVFMVLFGINFNLYFFVLIRKIGIALKSTELWYYIATILVSTAIISANVFSVYENLSETLRHSFFQVSSIVTTTGYATADFNNWPGLSKGLLFVLMFAGGCAGSTAGGLKFSRTIMLLKMIGRQIRCMIHPRSVENVRFEQKSVEEGVLNSVAIYFAIYMFLILMVFLLICFEPFGIEGNLSASVSCVNNVGPAFGGECPASNYSAYTDFSKVVLSFAMLLGRLEIFPMIIAFSPSTWIKK
ncbi:MAG: TrkH family potassium uptake protein [Clostridia bacterium]|nr:TrkH family potassium uptake protein [Clostridia bacterium]